jgi:hypothetical protein
MSLAHEQSPFPVLPYDAAAPPDLPPGHGGIAVHTESAAESAAPPPLVGVNGRPAVRAWGDALVVVPAGEHLVEVQQVTPRQSALVTVGEGEIVPVTYVDSGSPPSAAVAERRSEVWSRWSLPPALAVPLLIGLAVTWGCVASVAFLLLPLGLVFGKRLGDTPLLVAAAGWLVFAALILRWLWVRVLPRRPSGRGRR